MRSILTALLLLFKTELVLWENIMNDIDFEQCYKRFSKILKIARKVSVMGAYRKSTGFQMTFACILSKMNSKQFSLSWWNWVAKGTLFKCSKSCFLE